MKFTQKQLLQIIKEEIDAVMSEDDGTFDDTARRLDDRMVKMDAVTDALTELMDEIDQESRGDEDADVHNFVEYLLTACTTFYKTFAYVIAGYRADSAEYLGLQDAYREFLREMKMAHQTSLRTLSMNSPKLYKYLMATGPDHYGLEDVLDAVKADVDLPSQPEQPSSDGGISDERYKEVYNAGKEYALSDFDEDVLKAAGIDQDALTPAEEDAFSAGVEEGQEQVQMRGTEFDV